jgi:hypothetical protein
MPQGPVLIFDKSSLESLNLDEAVLLDNFYMSNITPLFFVECLADLEKSIRSRSMPEQLVGSLADLVHVHSDIFDVVTHLSCLLGGRVFVLTLIFPLKVKMPFSRRFSYVLLQSFRTPFTIAVISSCRRSGAKPPHSVMQRRPRPSQPRPSEAGALFHNALRITWRIASQPYAAFYPWKPCEGWPDWVV